MRSSWSWSELSVKFKIQKDQWDEHVYECFIYTQSYEETQRASPFPLARVSLGEKSPLTFNILSQVSVEIHLYTLGIHWLLDWFMDRLLWWIYSFSYTYPVASTKNAGKRSCLRLDLNASFPMAQNPEHRLGFVSHPSTVAPFKLHAMLHSLVTNTCFIKCKNMKVHHHTKSEQILF